MRLHRGSSTDVPNAMELFGLSCIKNFYRIIHDRGPSGSFVVLAPVRTQTYKIENISSVAEGCQSSMVYTYMG
jgi:hypothetical protein